MNEERTEPIEISGQAARRRFLKKSGGVAIAAPAAILLLSAASTNAVAQTYSFDASADDA